SVTPTSAEPGREEPRDVLGPARQLEARRDHLALEHEQRRRERDRELVEQIRSLLLRDAVVPERLVVAPVLKHLRDVPLDSTALPRTARMEVHEARLVHSVLLPQTVQLMPSSGHRETPR